MRHVSEWSLALIAAMLAAAVVWWNVEFSQTDCEIKTEREPITIMSLWEG